MKTTLTLVLTACLLCACHHRNSEPELRRYTPNSDYRRTYDTERTRHRSAAPQHERRARTDSMERLPYLPPFVMRWDCAPEPQMLGYAMR